MVTNATEGAQASDPSTLTALGLASDTVSLALTYSHTHMITLSGQKRRERTDAYVDWCVEEVDHTAPRQERVPHLHAAASIFPMSVVMDPPSTAGPRQSQPTRDLTHDTSDPAPHDLDLHGWAVPPGPTSIMCRGRHCLSPPDVPPVLSQYVELIVR